MLRRIDHDAILELRLDRPPANALDPGLIAALREAVSEAPAEGAEALVLSGQPGMFSAGLDVPHLLTLDRDDIRAAWADFFELLRAIAESPVPVAAAITGHSPAGGAVMAIYCDRRVMAEGKFRVGLNEVQVGIPMPAMIHDAVRRIVGTRQAERLCTEALLVLPEEALAIGLVDETAPAEEVVDRAVEWARRVLALPRGPMLATRGRVRADLHEIFDGRYDSEVARLADEWFSDETQAALHALVARLAERSGKASGS
jgi:enoyl-CoA hydratase/carnithine racemase